VADVGNLVGLLTYPAELGGRAGLFDHLLRAHMSNFSKSDAKGLWAVLWRVVVFGPFVWIAGVAILLVVLGAFAFPPIYAGAAFVSGNWALGITLLIPWFVLLRYCRPIMRWAFEGFDHGSV
jgi:hypothetical protein